MTSKHLYFMCVFLSVLPAVIDQKVAQPFSGHQPLPYDIVADLDEAKRISEPSGIVFHPGRSTLFAVGDNGDLYELTTNGSLLRAKHLITADFEGITVDPFTGLLYIAVEGEEKILEVDPENFRVQREFSIPREFQGATVMKAGGQGIEAITFVPDRNHRHGGTFFVANQSFSLTSREDRSAIFEIEVPLRAAGSGPVRILRAFYPGITDLSALHYNRKSGRVLVVSDENDLLLDMELSGRIVACYHLPGSDQEGIALDNEGALYIAQDCGGVLKLAPKTNGTSVLFSPPPKTGN